MVDVEPPEGLLHPVQRLPRLCLLCLPPLLPGARAQTTQEAELKCGAGHYTIIHSESPRMTDDIINYQKWSLKDEPHPPRQINSS